MSLRFAEIQSFVSDLARARAFYEGVLGLPVRQGGEGWLALDCGVELILMAGASPAPHQANYGRERATVLCLACGDIEAETARLRVAGVRFLTEILTVPQGRYAALEDPDGNLLELVQPREKA
ncbi:MAG: VOC family protein [bacterium]|nr:VOC family protein [bacterium]